MTRSKEIKLVLGGGGIPGILAHAGALGVIQNTGVVKVTDIGGVSAGAIGAAALARGLDCRALIIKVMTEEILIRKNYSFSALSNTPHFYKTNIFKILSSYFPGKFGDVDIPLNVVTNNIETKQQYVWNSRYRSDYPMANILYCSMCIPGAFKPIKLNYQYHTDGGVTSNLPVDDIFGSSPNTVALKISREGTAPGPPKGFIDFFVRTLIDIPIEHNMREDSYGSVVNLPVYGATLQTSINKEYANHIADQGAEAMEKWLLKAY